MKSVLITGSANGMGRETAIFLSKNGYHVFGLDINKANDEIENITQIICDITDIKSIENIIYFCNNLSGLNKDLMGIICSN